MPATRITQVDWAGNRIRDVWIIPKDEARECCVRNNIYAELTEADFAAEYAPISEEHVYVDAEHWESH
jgi:hypothetical protein